jgi:hypothetical protein
MCDYVRQFFAGKTVMLEAATEGCAGTFAADGHLVGGNIARNWAYIWPVARGIAVVNSGT